MNEIGVQAGFAGRDAGEHGMRPQPVQIVPAHMRDFQQGIARPDRRDVAGDPAQSLGDFILQTARRHQLHADADAEERAAARAHRFFQRLDHAGDRVEAAPAIGEGADAGQHDLIGRARPSRDREVTVTWSGRAPLPERRARRPCGRNADCPTRSRRCATFTSASRIREQADEIGAGRPERRWAAPPGRRAAGAASQREKKPRSAASTSAPAAMSTNRKPARSPRGGEQAIAFEPEPNRAQEVEPARGQAGRGAERTASATISAPRPQAPSARQRPRASSQSGPNRKAGQQKPSRTNRPAPPRRPDRPDRRNENGRSPFVTKRRRRDGANRASHSAPLVEGTRSAWRGSIAIAAPRARANPLKHDSAM